MAYHLTIHGKQDQNCRIIETWLQLWGLLRGSGPVKRENKHLLHMFINFH